MEDVEALLSQMAPPQASVVAPQAPTPVALEEPKAPVGSGGRDEGTAGDHEPDQTSGGKRKGKHEAKAQDQVDDPESPRGASPESSAPEQTSGGETGQTSGSATSSNDGGSAPAKKRAGRTSKKAAQTSAKQVRTARSVYIPSDVERVLVMARAAEGRSYTDIVLDAVNAHYKEAAELPDRAPVVQETTGGLFPRQSPQPRSKKGLNSIYLTDAETEVLDSVATQAGLKRSDLVSRCVRAALSNRVYTRMEVILELQDSGRPAAMLKERVNAVRRAGVVAPRIPEDKEGWVAMPERWFAGIGDELDDAQAHLKVGSWSEVAWAAMELSVQA
ncbi:hypothetical protein ACFV9C_42510 [Kribbella sp. NPDC059898]|uniref:hypothetical protein n=1 Tax=Kribbella sp. NPDC059898 TaxID=3346995 RepID=UPI003648C017